MKSLSASELRANIYRLLDHVIETGEPLEVQRKRRKVRIVPAAPVQRTERLKKQKWIVGDPEKLVSIDWSKEWHGDLP